MAAAVQESRAESLSRRGWPVLSSRQKGRQAVSLGKKGVGSLAFGATCVLSTFASPLCRRGLYKEKAIFAEEMLYADPRELTKLSKHWWFHFGRSLAEVAMPDDFYNVGPAESRYIDDIGLKAIVRDFQDQTEICNKDPITRSHFNLFSDVGSYLFRGSRRQALEFAIKRIARPETERTGPADQQLILKNVDWVGRSSTTVD